MKMRSRALLLQEEGGPHICVVGGPVNKKQKVYSGKLQVRQICKTITKKYDRRREIFVV